MMNASKFRTFSFWGLALLAAAATIALSAAAFTTAHARTPTMTGDPPEPVTTTQKRLKRLFPETYAKAAAEFGWRQFAGGKWGVLPEQMPERAVVLVHGVDDPGKVWMNLGPAVAKTGYTACEFRYPNDQPIRASAAYLLHSLAELRARGVKEVVIVAHSMGGLVSREMLTNPEIGYADSAKAGGAPTVKHLVMLGTPNHGSPLARVRFAAELRDQCVRLFNGGAHLLSGFVDGTGEAGTDLLPDSEFLKALNARPNPPGIALSIIAGVASPVSKEALERMAKTAGAEPDPARRAALERLRDEMETLAEGVGDGCVSVTSAKLEGVTDIVTVPGTHLSAVRNVLESSGRVPPAVPLVLERLAKDWPPPEKPAAGVEK